jgi:hypothetical protein
MKRSWGFLIARQYNHQFENFYATVIQQAYRNYKKRPESSAKRIWEVVRNDGTPNRKKFLGILRYNQMIMNPETQKEYAIAWDEFHALFRKSYSKYIGKINPAKVIPLYEKYIYCSPSRWIEVKKYQLRRRLDKVAYGAVDFYQRFTFELLSTIAYYEKYSKNR